MLVEWAWASCTTSIMALNGMTRLDRIIDDLTKLAKEAGCYKVTLECSDDNIGFYAKCGLSRKGNQMCIYF